MSLFGTTNLEWSGTLLGVARSGDTLWNWQSEHVISHFFNATTHRGESLVRAGGRSDFQKSATFCGVLFVKLVTRYV